MSPKPLLPCIHCARYLRPDETSCPFCGGSLPPRERSAPPRVPRGTSRAAAFAMHAAVAAAAVGAAGCADDDCDPATERCEESPGDADTSKEAGQPVADAAPTDAAPDTATWDSSIPDSGAQPDTGTTEPVDSGIADAMADAAPDDAGQEEDGFVPIPLYGGVFPDPRTRVKV